MNESGVVKLRELHGVLPEIEQCSNLWSLNTAKALAQCCEEVVPLLKTKKTRKIKLNIKHILSTLRGVIEGRRNKIIEREDAKAHLKKLLPLVAELREQIQTLDDFMPDGEEVVPVPKRKSIVIRPGVDSVSLEAQHRLSEAITDENGGVRQEDREISPMEKLWEEAEFQRIVRQQRLKEWDEEFYGKFDVEFDRYEKEIGLLPKILTKQKALLQIGPVVPTSKVESLFRVSALERSGVRISRIAGCSIFEQQLLLGVNTDTQMDEYVEISDYKKQARAYREKMAVYKDRFRPLSVAETHIKDLEAENTWYDEMPAEGFGEDKEKAEDTRNARRKWIAEEITRTKQKIASMEATLAPLKAEYLKIEDEYKAFVMLNRPNTHGKLSQDLTDKTFERAEECLEKINSRLTPDEHISFVCNQGVVHGQLTYYWVMKDVHLAKWSYAISFGKIKLEILDWCFPRRSITNAHRSLEYELEIQNGLTQLVLSLVKKQSVRGIIDAKVAKYLKQRRHVYTDYYKEMVTKIIAESAEVFDAELVKPVKLKAPKNSLLQKLRHNN